MTAKKYVQTIYVLWSKIYDKYIDKLFSFNRAKVIKELDIKKGDKILEIGVGTGLNLKHYPKNCTVYGIDFSKAMLEKAKQKKNNAKVVIKYADATKLPFKENFFDKALTTYVLRVAPNPFRIMTEVEKVTKRNARFVILDQFKEGNSLWLKIVQPLKLTLGWGKEYELNKLIKNTSWKIIKQKQIGKMKGTKIIVLQNQK